MAESITDTILADTTALVTTGSGMAADTDVKTFKLEFPMMRGMMWVWTLVGILLVVLLVIAIAKLLKK